MQLLKSQLLMANTKPNSVFYRLVFFILCVCTFEMFLYFTFIKVYPFLGQYPLQKNCCQSKEFHI